MEGQLKAGDSRKSEKILSRDSAVFWTGAPLWQLRPRRPRKRPVLECSVGEEYLNSSALSPFVRR